MALGFSLLITRFFFVHVIAQFLDEASNILVADIGDHEPSAFATSSVSIKELFEPTDVVRGAIPNLRFSELLPWRAQVGHLDRDIDVAIRVGFLSCG